MIFALVNPETDNPITNQFVLIDENPYYHNRLEIYFRSDNNAICKWIPELRELAFYGSDFSKKETKYLRIDFMNIDSLLDGLAFDRAWIEDRLNNDDKRRRYKKIRKALGYSS